MPDRSSPDSNQMGAILRELGKLNSRLDEGLSKLDEKIDSKTATILAAVHRIADDRLRDKFDIERGLRRTGALEHQMALVSRGPDVPDWRPDPREITGTHDFAIIKKEHDALLVERKAEEDRQREGRTWTQRWLFGVAAAILVATVSACLGFAASHLTVTAPPPASPGR